MVTLINSVNKPNMTHYCHVSYDIIDIRKDVENEQKEKI